MNKDTSYRTVIYVNVDRVKQCKQSYRLRSKSV